MNAKHNFAFKLNNNKVKDVFFVLAISGLFLSCNTNSGTEKQYFEGIVIYQNEYLIKTNKVDSAYLHKTYGQTAKLLFKEGNYIEKYGGGYMLEQLYNKKENKIYMKKRLCDTLYWLNCGKPSKAAIRSTINKKKEKILGIECDELISIYPDKKVSYYYNSDTLRIDPDWYTNFTLFEKNLNTQRMKSLYLKYKIEYPDFIATVTATSIKSAKIENRVFKIPVNKILIEL